MQKCDKLLQRLAGSADRNKKLLENVKKKKEKKCKSNPVLYFSLTCIASSFRDDFIAI